MMISILYLLPVYSRAQEQEQEQECEYEKTPVYRNNVRVGYLYTDTELEEYDCYSLDTLTVLGKRIIVQTAVDYSKSFDGTKRFYPNFFVSLITKNDKQAIIEFYTFHNVNVFRLYLRKEKSDTLRIYEELSWYPRASIDIEIAEDDYNSIRCSHICRKTVSKLPEEKIIFTDFFDFDADQCFDCPQRYSLSKCLEMRRRKKKFVWKY